MKEEMERYGTQDKDMNYFSVDIAEVLGRSKYWVSRE